MELREKQIKTCKELIHMYQDLMIETQSQIRDGQGKIEVNRSKYKTYKAHYEEYQNMLKVLEGENHGRK